MGLPSGQLTICQNAVLTSLIGSISFIGVGTGSTAFAITQTQLVGEVKRESLVATSSASNYYVVSMFLDVTEANSKTLNEIGTFNSSSGATMISRNIITTATKTSSKEFFYDVRFAVTATNISA